MHHDIELRPATEDLLVDELAIELVSLSPAFRAAHETPDKDHVRANRIIAELDGMKLSPYQKKQVVSFVQSHWVLAANQAMQLGLFKGAARSEYNYPLGQILAGVCLTRANPELAQANIDRAHTPA